MKKIFLTVLMLFSFALNAQVTTSPSTFEATQSGVVLTFNKTGTALASYTGLIYAHMGVTVNGTNWQNTIGTWGNNTTQPQFVQTSAGASTYSFTIPSDLFTYFGVPTTSSITKICIVFRNAAGTVQTSPDIFVNVGAFQPTLTSPVVNSTAVLSSGSSFSISASNTGGSANYVLTANGSAINFYTGSTYSYTDTNITVNKAYVLTVTLGGISFNYNFYVLVNPGTQSVAMASGLEDGINYDPADPTKATLVLTAPGKDFVYVAGSFNNWQPTAAHAMKIDTGTGKFWVQLTGLTVGTNYTYQYWVVDMTPTTNSQKLIKCADPYSTLVLSPYDDPWIPAVSYPSMPVYPAGQQYEVTVLQTGQTPYPWSAATTNFVKPEKDKLVVYEVLIRDFDANRNFQTLIDRMDYFKNLKINAIELMPVMEFEGDESWGYNPSFHMALDKYYGTKAKMQEFVDLCHQNGIAVILDLVLNHAMGRSPIVRMWQVDPTNSGYGTPASDNPYFNMNATHSYGVGNDFNHSSANTKYYVKRVLKQWTQEFKVDGFRWDLTKGFTQACSSGDDTCTNAYQADRVATLKDYADYEWSLDPNQYVIFEHLGIDSEEQQWANYRVGESPSKGIMLWGEFTYPYTQLIEGYTTGADISRMLASNHGFSNNRLMGYPESHDKERLMYSAKTWGVGSGSAPVAGNLNNCLTRMSSIGAISLLVPGPKMIWHFADLGMDDSINTCSDGTVNSSCKTSTKPQNQWTSNWLANANRSKVYSDYSKMINLKKTETVFSSSCAFSPAGGNALQQRIYLWNDTLPTTSLKNVVILTNFGTDSANVTPDFPYTGTWVNLMDNTIISVTSTTNPITIEAGGFRIYGNQAPALANQLFDTTNSDLELYPNPASTYFTLNKNTTKVEVYSITGQLIKSFDNEHSNNYQYNVSDLRNGIYLVKSTTENGSEKALKLIKN